MQFIKASVIEKMSTAPAPHPQTFHPFIIEVDQNHIRFGVPNGFRFQIPEWPTPLKIRFPNAIYEPDTFSWRLARKHTFQLNSLLHHWFPQGSFAEASTNTDVNSNWNVSGCPNCEQLHMTCEGCGLQLQLTIVHRPRSVEMRKTVRLESAVDAEPLLQDVEMQEKPCARTE